MGKPWLGNSQQGKNIGINKNPNNYAFRILRDEEIKLINLKTEGIMNKISSLNECPLNLMNIKENLFLIIKNIKNILMTITYGHYTVHFHFLDLENLN